jgi:hypothetical protein
MLPPPNLIDGFRQMLGDVKLVEHNLAIGFP